MSKETLTHPCTTCGCYDGRHVCSHLLAFLLLIRCVQQSDVDKQKFESKMPKNPILIQNALTLVENVSSTDSYKNAKRIKLEEDKTLKCDEIF